MSCSLAQNVKDSPLPVSNSSHFQPSHSTAIPTYGAILASIVSLLKFLVCVILIVIPLYLYKKNSISSHRKPATVTLEVDHVHVSLHPLEEMSTQRFYHTLLFQYYSVVKRWTTFVWTGWIHKPYTYTWCFSAQENEYSTEYAALWVPWSINHTMKEVSGNIRILSKICWAV